MQAPIWELSVGGPSDLADWLRRSLVCLLFEGKME